jgi:hypothetical protein
MHKKEVGSSIEIRLAPEVWQTPNEASRLHAVPYQLLSTSLYKFSLFEVKRSDLPGRQQLKVVH